MGLSQKKFLGTVSVSLANIMILPIFSAKPLAPFQNWGKAAYASDYGKAPCSAADGCSFSVISFPSKVEPQLVERLQHFRRN